MVDIREMRSRFAILDQQFGEDPDLPCGMLTWRADDICTGRRWRMTRHDRPERTGSYMLMGQAIGQVSDPESCCCGGNESYAVVGFEASLRTNRDDLVAIHELPAFGALHESLMSDEFLRRLGRPMRLDV